jgi:hypothetical protein
MAISVPDDLRAKAKLYEERNKLYGDNYKRFGPIMMLLFPTGIELVSADDHNRFGIFVQIVAKVTRYAEQFAKGGHDDSLDDTAVYSMMLKELDTELRERPAIVDEGRRSFGNWIANGELYGLILGKYDLPDDPELHSALRELDARLAEGYSRRESGSPAGSEVDPVESMLSEIDAAYRREEEAEAALAAGVSPPPAYPVHPSDEGKRLVPRMPSENQGERVPAMPHAIEEEEDRDEPSDRRSYDDTRSKIVSTI